VWRTALQQADSHVVLANPPFKGSIDKGDINEDLRLKTTKTELLFVNRIMNLLCVGGRAGVIVPDGVLFGSSNAHRDTHVRRMRRKGGIARAKDGMPAIESQHGVAARAPYSSIAGCVNIANSDQVISSPPLSGTLELSKATVTVTFPAALTRGYPRVVWR